MTEGRLTRILLRIVSGGVLVFLYLPLGILAVLAFNESRSQAWPPTGFTFKWFGEAASNPTLISAFVNSIIVATIATALALVLGHARGARRPAVLVLRTADDLVPVHPADRAARAS